MNGERRWSTPFYVVYRAALVLRFLALALAAAVTSRETAPKLKTGREYDARSRGRKNRGLRLIALFKFFKATLLIAVCLGALQLLNPDLVAHAQRLATAFLTGSDHRLLQHLLAAVTGLAPSRLELVALGSFIYAGLFTTEGVGLWRGRRWAEYLTVVATASFLPIEILELVYRLTVPRVTALLLNLLVVVYLVRRLRPPHAANHALSSL